MYRVFDWVVSAGATVAIAQTPAPSFDILSYLERFGAFALMVGYFLLRDRKRELDNQKHQTEQDQFINTTLLNLVREAVTGLDRNATGLATVAEAIKYCQAKNKEPA